jgi:type IV pilus assembly protein PilB
MAIFDDANLKTILLDGSYVAPESMAAAEAFGKAHHVSLLDSLYAEGRITKSLIGQAIAEYLKLPYADLRAHQPGREQIKMIPEDSARKYRIVVFSGDTKSLVIASDNPGLRGLKAELKRIFPAQTITLAYSSAEDIETSFLHYQKTLDLRFAEIFTSDIRVAPRILDEIFNDAILYRATDIHFEPQPMDVVIRFRIDGALQEVARLPKERYENLLNRIKVQSRLRMDEHFATQDGSLRYDHNTESVDLRTSIAPTIEGEKIVLRVLGSYVSNLALTSLGLSDRNMETLDQVTRKPFGMILVTGPTGSGKTTTLYALVKSMNETDVNITTIEDPVEYKLLGINQIQVNLQTDLTFAKGLRSIVRQDPDIILVGEIRDNETAEIAVNAALTGHLLLSTFHANDAATAIPRLLDMGIEPFLLASTLNVILAQRLVRKICKNCKHSMAVLPRNLPIKQAEKYFGTQEVNLYEGGKCVACNQTGYKDRVAITELIVVTPQMQALILTNPSSQQVWALARQQGTRSLFEDGLDKVKEGVTSLDELLRVAEAPADVS